jgi:hypothetical protein
MENAVNWKKISWLAFSIYLLEIILGLIEGSTDIGSGLFPGISRLYAFRVALFVTCSIAFAFYTVKNPSKPLAHASLALLLEVFVATAVMVAPYPWSGSTPVWMFVVLDWFVLGSALVVGTLLGITINHFATRKADA